MKKKEDYFSTPHPTALTRVDTRLWNQRQKRQRYALQTRARRIGGEGAATHIPDLYGSKKSYVGCWLHCTALLAEADPRNGIHDGY